MTDRCHAPTSLQRVEAEMHTLLQTLGLAAAVAETVAAQSRVAAAMFEGDIHTAYEVGQREAEADWLRTQGG